MNLNQRLSGDKSFRAWSSVLHCLVSCVQNWPSEDHMPGDEAYEAARESARRGLQSFSVLLRRPVWDGMEPTLRQQMRETLNDIFHLFRRAAQPVGLISFQLVEGMAYYLHSYERACDCTYEPEILRNWILRLERDTLGAGSVRAAHTALAFS